MELIISEIDITDQSFSLYDPPLLQKGILNGLQHLTTA
jgi:hypothetical protein